MAYKGLYGQAQGNEKRVESAQFVEHCTDNGIAEGDHVAVLSRMAKQATRDGNWIPFNNYSNQIVATGHSRERRDSMVRRATFDLGRYL
jgi:hypothetical protein